MTFEASGRSATSACNGVTTVFSVPFQFRRHGLRVFLLDAAGDPNSAGQELSEGVHFTVSGDGDAGGASITTTSAYPAGKYIRRWRASPLDQKAEYTPNDGFPAKAHEGQLDRLSMVTEEIIDDAGRLDARALKLPSGEVSPPLPATADMLGRLLGMDGEGNWYPSFGGGNDPALRGDLFSQAGGALVRYRRGESASLRTMAAMLAERGVRVTEYGADPTGASDSHAAIMAAKAAAIALRQDLVFPKGTYSHAAMLDLSGFELRIRGEGEVHLQCTDPDTEVCVLVSGAGAGAAKQVLQDINIWGANGASQIGLRTLNSQLSTFRNITVRNVGRTGVEIIGDVLSVYDSVQVVARGRPLESIPARGFVLTGNAQISATAAIVFINCMAEAATERGWYLAQAINCKWVGGTSEGLGYPIDPDDPKTPAIGMLIDVNCNRHIFDELFFEHNIGGDVVIYGSHNRFMGCTMASLSLSSPWESVRSIIVKPGAVGNIFEDGEAFAAEVEAGADGTIFRRMMLGHQVYDAGTGTKIDDCRQLNLSGTRYPSRYAGNVEHYDPLAWDWYEERNDRTAELAGADSDGTLTQTGGAEMTRDGNRCAFTAEIFVSAVTDWPTGAVLVRTNLPPAAKETPVQIGYQSGLTLPAGCNAIHAAIAEASANIRFYGIKSDGTNPVLLTDAHLSGNSAMALILSGKYRVAGT